MECKTCHPPRTHRGTLTERIAAQITDPERDRRIMEARTFTPSVLAGPIERFYRATPNSVTR